MIAVVVLVGVFALLASFAKRDSNKLEKAETPAEVVVHGGGSIAFGLGALVVFVILLLVVGKMGAPLP